MKKITLVLVAIVLVATYAFAEQSQTKTTKEATKPAAPTVAPTPAPAPAMMIPKPAPELENLSAYIGSGKCEGKVVANGKEMSSKGSWKADWELDNFWLVFQFEEKKAKDSPYAHKMASYMGYDSANKTYIRRDFDNMGGVAKLTSKGWEGDKMSWTGTVNYMGQEMPIQESIARTGSKVTHVKGSVTMNGQPMTDWDLSCKK